MATVMNAGVRPVVGPYIEKLDAGLNDRDIAAPLDLERVSIQNRHALKRQRRQSISDEHTSAAAASEKVCRTVLFPLPIPL